jgi:hypothetical protein
VPIDCPSPRPPGAIFKSPPPGSPYLALPCLALCSWIASFDTSSLGAILLRQTQCTCTHDACLHWGGWWATRGGGGNSSSLEELRCTLSVSATLCRVHICSCPSSCYGHTFPVVQYHQCVHDCAMRGIEYQPNQDYSCLLNTEMKPKLQSCTHPPHHHPPRTYSHHITFL